MHTHNRFDENHISNPDVDMNARQIAHEMLKRRGFETELGPVDGQQFETLLMYPDGIERRRILRNKEHPENIARLEEKEALIDTFITNRRYFGTDSTKSSLWLDSIEGKLRASLGLNEIPIANERDLVQVVPCLGSSLDLHYGIDGFVLAWKPEFVQQASGFKQAIQKAQSAQSEIDYARLDRRVTLKESQRFAVRQTRVIAANMLDAALRSGYCSIATFDLSQRPEKREGATLGYHGGMKADLLVTETGGVFHQDFESMLHGAGGDTFNYQRDFELKKNASRRVFIAKALTAILGEKSGGIAENLRWPGEPAEWKIAHNRLATSRIDAERTETQQRAMRIAG